MILKSRFMSKPWGREELLVVNRHYAAKILIVDRGEKISLQYHEKKHETMYFYKGKAKVTIGKRTLIAKPGTIIEIKPGTVHRVEGIAKAYIFEVSTPHLKDVVRLEDKYKR